MAKIMYDPKEKYCSSSPDIILGVVINFGCYLHDRHYRNERAIRYTRKKADQLLKNHIYRDLKKSNLPFEFRLRWKKVGVDWIIINKNWSISKTRFLIGFRRLLARPVSNWYYWAVRLFAKRAWVNG